MDNYHIISITICLTTRYGFRYTDKALTSYLYWPIIQPSTATSFNWRTRLITNLQDKPETLQVMKVAAREVRVKVGLFLKQAAKQE